MSLVCRMRIVSVRAEPTRPRDRDARIAIRERFTLPDLRGYRFRLKRFGTGVIAYERCERRALHSLARRWAGSLLTISHANASTEAVMLPTLEAIPKPETSYGVSQTASSARRLGSWRTGGARVTEATPRALNLIPSPWDHVLYGFQPCSFDRTGLPARSPVEAPCWRPKTTMAIAISGFGSASSL